MIATIIFCLLFTGAFFLHEKYRIKDDQTADEIASASFKLLWHRYKGYVHVSVYAYVFYNAYLAHHNLLYASGLTLFFASFFWMFLDGLLNTFLFKKEWWYVGTTALTDTTLKRSASSALKVLLLTASVVMLLIWWI